MNKIRKTKILPPLLLAALALSMAACTKTGIVDLSTIEVTSVFSSECLTSHITGKGWDNPDTIDVQYNDGTLIVHHKNLSVNCDFDSVDVNLATSNDTITIFEDGSTNSADCICEIENHFQIKNLPQGNYVLVFKSCKPSPIIITLNL